MPEFPILVVSLALVLPASAAAQVGHDPANSPYRDIRNRTNLVATGWYLRGSGGRLGLGPQSGEVVGARYETRLTGPSDAFLGLALGRFERMVIDPDGAEATRVTGPVDQSVVFVSVGLSVLLTGDKTWNGLAPYLGAALGLGFGGGVASDSSEFRFSAKFVSGPHAGIRFYATRSLSLRLEGRLLFWQLKYPSGFFSEPLRAPNDPPVLNQDTDPASEWTSHPTLIFAVGYALRL